MPGIAVVDGAPGTFRKLAVRASHATNSGVDDGEDLAARRWGSQTPLRACGPSRRPIECKHINNRVLRAMVAHGGAAAVAVAVGQAHAARLLQGSCYADCGKAAVWHDEESPTRSIVKTPAALNVSMTCPSRPVSCRSPCFQTLPRILKTPESTWKSLKSNRHAIPTVAHHRKMRSTSATSVMSETSTACPRIQMRTSAQKNGQRL